MTCQIIEFPVVFKVSDQQKVADSELCIKISGKINALFRSCAYVFVKYINGIRFIDVNYGMVCDLKDYTAHETNYIYLALVDDEDGEEDRPGNPWYLRYDAESMKIVDDKKYVSNSNMSAYVRKVVKKIIEEALV